jgi:CopG family transcriptional regulator, nickel-responsive regulator
MGALVRTGVSLERDLLAKFDRSIGKKRYQNRSEAIRDLIRDHLVEEELEKNAVLVGTLTIVYDHHRPNLTEKLVEAQHHAGGKVLAATHVHLDHHNCLEVVIMKGRGEELKSLADSILSLRGVKHGKLVVTSTGKDLE